MSKKLRDFLDLLRQEHVASDDVDIGTFVTWLRRRVGLLQNLDTSAVKAVIRNSSALSLDKDELMLQQGRRRAGSEPLRFFILLRGSASIYVNPFIAQGKRRQSTGSSIENVLIAATLGEKESLKPKSAASGTSRRTAPSRTSEAYEPVPEQPENDASDAESDIMIGNDTVDDVKIIPQTKGIHSPPSNSTPKLPRDVDKVAREGQTETQERSQEATPEVLSRLQTATQKSRQSKSSQKKKARSRLGKFVLNYEKGKYFDEETLLDEDNVFSASVIADEATDVMVINEHTFNEFVKSHQEKETTTMINFVDMHPFFSGLPLHTRGMLQIGLKIERHLAGNFIVKQGDAINRLAFIVSGSAEMIVEPSRHRLQYPTYWPFEALGDVYYNECDWLRDSRRRFYQRQYEFGGEVSRRTARENGATKKQEVSICAIQRREVLGITEIMLNLRTHMASMRCLHDCDVYMLNLRSFRRVIKRYPHAAHVIWAYVLMKMQHRLDSNLSGKVPLFKTLYTLAEKEAKEKAEAVSVTLNVERQRQRESVMLELLEYFKQDKAALAPHSDPRALMYKELMKERAALRKSIRERTQEFGAPAPKYVRRGCLASVKNGRKPLSLHQLRDPMSELMVKLRMEGTFVSSQKELEDMIMRFSVTPVSNDVDVSNQAERVLDEEYNVLRYRRYGNRLVRNFAKMMDRRDPRVLLSTRNRDYTSLLDDGMSEPDMTTLIRDVIDEEDEFFEKFDPAYTSTRPATFKTGCRSRTTLHPTRPTTNKSAFTRPTTYKGALTRPTTYKSAASTNTYKTLQFDRRSVTPNTLENRIREFHYKYGGTDEELDRLPVMKNHRDFWINPDEKPVPGGKVFVTVVPCVSCNKNVLLKNHNHIRCQMLHSLPMDRVKNYKPM
ncbi:hypothetical protein DPMN_065430 [Dreissena polymorpha]|uniref:Cyclic nucleotide-binding domain-containing protein n=2 Tax=Dreissena polymorpha TaxID=45954 RepID=A0A9D4BJL8_DREPO|nr:hypothetical protein DPMN_065430 [Dreissena polymorpha]